ncbi:hypothetical protein BC834DRAFT_911033 [Gloeopeniophorella convolvens]|nr:hypothetical protein BC834DRAFT_911033 [Gloeopeniophorella convolvens]
MDFSHPVASDDPTLGPMRLSEVNNPTPENGYSQDQDVQTMLENFGLGTTTEFDSLPRHFDGGTQWTYAGISFFEATIPAPDTSVPDPHPHHPFSSAQPHNLSSTSYDISNLFVNDEQRWQAIFTRDARADGVFLYCVLTTHIYCRPTCASRRPAQSNVAFVKSAVEAAALGCRACLRCSPDSSSNPTTERQMNAVARLKLALSADLDVKVTVKQVSEEIGISMWHLNRLFKKEVGFPPKQWVMQLRERAFRRYR